MKKNKKRILITGAYGMVGKALINLVRNPDNQVFAPTKNEVDFADAIAVKKYFIQSCKSSSNDSAFDLIYHLAAKVGGIKSNIKHVGEFYTTNTLINTNLLHECRMNNCDRVISVLSTCIYPTEEWVTYPLTENQIHSGPPHKSNFGHAYAKRMLDVQSRAYRKQYGVDYVTVIANSLFGVNDNFNLQSSHMVPAAIRKIWEARQKNKKSVSFCGSKNYVREFTYALDFAKILLVVSNEYHGATPINVGNTEKISISKLVKIIANILDYDGKIMFDATNPDVQPAGPSSNQLFLSKTSWEKYMYTPLEVGLSKTCKWFVEKYPNIRGVTNE